MNDILNIIGYIDICIYNILIWQKYTRRINDIWFIFFQNYSKIHKIKLIIVVIKFKIDSLKIKYSYVKIQVKKRYAHKQRCQTAKELKLYQKLMKYFVPRYVPQVLDISRISESTAQRAPPGNFVSSGCPLTRVRHLV